MIGIYQIGSKCKDIPHWIPWENYLYWNWIFYEQETLVGSFLCLTWIEQGACTNVAKLYHPLIFSILFLVTKKNIRENFNFSRNIKKLDFQYNYSSHLIPYFKNKNTIITWQPPDLNNNCFSYSDLSWFMMHVLLDIF